MFEIILEILVKFSFTLFALSILLFAFNEEIRNIILDEWNESSFPGKLLIISAITFLYAIMLQIFMGYLQDFKGK